MSNSLKKDYFWNTTGVLAQNLISPLLLIAVTRLNGVDVSGLFSFAFSLALIFWAIGVWGGRTYQVSDAKREFAAQSYVFVRLLLAVVMLVGAVVFSVLNGYDVTKTSVIVALVLFKVVESVADVLYGVLQVNHRLYISGRSLLYKALFGFITFLIIDSITGSILFGSLGLVAINALILFVYDIPHALRYEKILVPVSHITMYTKEAITIIRRCWPIAVVMVLSMFSLNIPRYFVDMFHANEIGYFGILAMPITALGLMITFIIQPNVVRLSQYLEKKELAKFDTVVTKLIIVSTALSLVILIATYLIGVEVLRLIFGVEFEQYKEALIVMVIGAIINAYVSIYINILVIMRHFKAQFFTLLFTNIGLIFAALFIVREQGLMGGAVAYMFVNLLQACILFYTYRQLIGKKLTSGV